MKKTILLITHEAPVEQAVAGALAGFNLETVRTAEAASEQLRRRKPALVILDHDLKQDEGLQLFRQLRLLAPYTGFLLLSHENDIPLAVQAAKLGAADFLKKPVVAKELRRSVEQTLAAAEATVFAAAGLPWLQGESPALKKMFEAIGSALPAQTNLILTAERGINKSEVADYAHRRSLKRKSRLQVIDLSSFHRENLEGSFWATVQEAVGENSSAVDEEDRCGTLYLENIESLEESFRLSIFEFFKEKKAKFDPEVLVVIGLYAPQSLPHALAKHYLQVAVPPLCERKVDLPLLVSRELAALALRHDKPVRALSADLLYLLGLYDWPGNYDELSALLEIGVLAAPGEVLDLADLPLDFQTLIAAAIKAAHTKGTLSLEEAKRWLEKLTYKTLFAKMKSDPGAVARFLDLPRTTLAERAAELGSDLLN